MIQYTFSYTQANSHYIDIEVLISECKGNSLQLQLPSWRPGRYELGNFAKNVKGFNVEDLHGNKLPFRKKTKDLWEIETGGASMIKAKYSYYAAEINAGSTYLDNAQLYVNPVNCCVYVPERMSEEHVLELKLPVNYKVCGSLKKSSEFTLHATNFEELADSPFIASASVKTISFFANDLPVHLHFMGECLPDEKKLVEDFKKFTEHSLDFFGDAPISEYHFLFQILPYRFYHGVEHLKSTVIALGPGYNLMQGSTYEDLLGVSCHELFHLWNIKTIRPVEMQPYDYTKENYARTGYVYEGFTTYYGDLLLYQCGVFNQEQYFKTLEERLDKHFHNYGRFNLSLANSSFDNWLDGYVPGVPYRKVSIYDEGNLFAFMLDVNILEKSDGKKSLKDVLRKLYDDYGKKNKGYSESEIVDLVNEAAGTNLQDLFTKYCYGTEDYFPELKRCMNLLGMEIVQEYSSGLHESKLGFKLIDGINGKKISLIAPDSPGYNAGLMMSDEIIAVNNKHCKMDAKEWINYYLHSNSEIKISALRMGELIELKISSGDKSFFPNSKIKVLSNSNEKQSRMFTCWTS